MLAVSPLRNPKDERENEMASFAMDGDGYEDFPDLLDSIDFDDLFAGIEGGEDMLPDLEMDHEMLAKFGLIAESDTKTPSPDNNNSVVKSGSGSDPGSSGSSSSPVKSGANLSVKRGEKRRKSTVATSKNPTGKKKGKVDWTPELHRRFVQAVEHLGLDKAVPSRILEVMGIDCLTRHHIASHLQKYRSHRKHLLAREAEAASWGRRRQAYGGAVKDVGPWIAPTATMGFPPAPPAFRPLHVWGHPSVDQSLMHGWHKPLTPPPHAWPPPTDPSFWISHHPHVPTPGTPCYPPHLTPLANGIPPPVGSPQGQEPLRLPPNVHPSKESIDAAIGDALSKPWLPLPLGLKPPSVDGVMVELQRQGVSKVPLTC